MIKKLQSYKTNKIIGIICAIAWFSFWSILGFATNDLFLTLLCCVFLGLTGAVAILCGFLIKNKKGVNS